MTRHDGSGVVPAAIRRKPLHAGKFVGILLTLVLGVAVSFPDVDTEAILGDSLLADGQFLALVSIPLIGLGVDCLVFVETLVAGYRVFRSEGTVRDRIRDRPGYVLIRGAEAAVALVGVAIIATAVPPLLVSSTPAPAGVGIVLLLLAVGIGILSVSLLRSFVELVAC